MRKLSFDKHKVPKAKGFLRDFWRRQVYQAMATFILLPVLGIVALEDPDCIDVGAFESNFIALQPHGLCRREPAWDEIGRHKSGGAAERAHANWVRESHPSLTPGSPVLAVSRRGGRKVVAANHALSATVRVGQTLESPLQTPC